MRHLQKPHSQIRHHIMGCLIRAFTGCLFSIKNLIYLTNTYPSAGAIEYLDILDTENFTDKHCNRKDENCMSPVYQCFDELNEGELRLIFTSILYIKCSDFFLT